MGRCFGVWYGDWDHGRQHLCGMKPLCLPLLSLLESPCHGQGGTTGTAMATARELCQGTESTARATLLGGTEVGTMEGSGVVARTAGVVACRE